MARLIMPLLLKLIAVPALLLSAVYALWLATMVSSTTIALGDTGYAVTYSIAWGRGMDERVDVYGLGKPAVRLSGDWLDTWESYSGVALYRSEDGNTYIFGVKPGIYRFDVTTRLMDYHCATSSIVSHTAAGASIAALTANQRSALSIDRKDHAYINLVEPSQDQRLPENPPASRYYEGLRFLGMFRVTEGRRGTDGSRAAAFASSADIHEPMNALDGDCKWSSLVRDVRDL
nr:hypothetical protein RTCK_00508 [Rhizobium sp. TCK]